MKEIFHFNNIFSILSFGEGGDQCFGAEKALFYALFDGLVKPTKYLSRRETCVCKSNNSGGASDIY